MTLLVEYQKFIYRTDMKANPRKCYIFGDNVKRVGFGGQAKEMRGEPNAFGIATKLAPTYNQDDFMCDCPECFAIVRKDVSNLYFWLKSWEECEGVVVPADGIGTGIAKLKENAPIILEYINSILFDEIKKWTFDTSIDFPTN